MILVAAALDANPTAAINAPIIVTTLHPKRFVKELAMGPAPSVTPTNIDGIKDTEARPVPSNPLINATTNIPKEYVIPSAKKEHFNVIDFVCFNFLKILLLYIMV